MKQKIITHLLKILSTVTGKLFFYITPSTHNSLGNTAVWSSEGFWYVGNVYDSSDIAYGIAQNGIVEKYDTELAIKILGELQEKHTDITVYDIGANTGYYGILAATKFAATVHSFEPIAEHVDCIKKSAYMNRVDNLVTTHTVALGSSKDKLPLKIAGSGSTLTDDFLGDTLTPVLTVPVEALDTIDLPAPHFIKIDVEGYEWEVLQGAKETIAKHRPICFIEIAKTFHSRNFDNKHWDDIISFFTSQGYRMQQNTEGGPISPELIPDGAHMYLFTPIK